jgi:hypothetical protein
VAVDADGNIYAAEGPNSLAQAGGAFTKYSLGPWYPRMRVAAGESIAIYDQPRRWRVSEGASSRTKPRSRRHRGPSIVSDDLETWTMRGERQHR